jgi:hypothetical protein
MGHRTCSYCGEPLFPKHNHDHTHDIAKETHRLLGQLVAEMKFVKNEIKELKDKE